jgi:hypothetical protein
MFIVAIISLVFNLIQIKILHGGDQPLHAPGHSCGHGHSHGGEDAHGHAHGAETDIEADEEHHGHAHGDHGHGHSHGEEEVIVDLNRSTITAPKDEEGKTNLDDEIPDTEPLLCLEEDKEHGHSHSHEGHAHSHTEE